MTLQVSYCLSIIIPKCQSFLHFAMSMIGALSPNAILRGICNQFAHPFSRCTLIKSVIQTLEYNTVIRAYFQVIRSNFVCILSELKSNKMKVRAWLLINVICVGVLLTGTI